MIESADEFLRLRTSEDPSEYRRAASEPATLETWQAVIARFPHMREWVVHNKTVPEEILAQLAYDPDARVRTTVAGKRKLSRELAEHLARDSDAGVRSAVARNRGRSVDRAILERLADDADLVVARDARERLNLGLG